MTTQKIQVAVKATREEVWAALTSPDISPAYYYGFEAHYDLAPGARYAYRVGEREVISGRMLDIVEATRLRMTFAGSWTPAVAELPESIVTYELGDTAMSVPGLTALTLTHEGLPDSETAADVEKGWVLILSGLKTLLETGEPLVAAPPA